MDYDFSVENNDIKIICSGELENFIIEFIEYYNENINHIKQKLLIDKNVQLLVALTDNEKLANFVYGKSGFSGFFTETGAFAYINLNGNRTKDYMFKGIMHELTHHLYKYYVYGADKDRITWVDEGIAQFISGQKEELEDKEKYQLFIEENLDSISDINLNKLAHEDRSFGNNNGYNLSYIAIRYLYETNSHDEFINIIKSEDRLLELGNTILTNAKEYYGIGNKKR